MERVLSTNSNNNQHINIIGLHCFQWGNITSSSKLCNLWQTITQSLIDLASEIKIDLQVIDLGGGLGIPYYNEDEKLNIEDIKAALDKLKTEYPQIDFWLELGRYAVGECGVYITQIIDKKMFMIKPYLYLRVVAII